MKNIFIGFTLIASISSFATPDTLTVSKGDRVVYSLKSGTGIIQSYHSGTASEVFENGEVTINSDSHSDLITRKINEIGKAEQCFQTVCSGDRVIYTLKSSSGIIQSHHRGTVNEVFDNGMVKINSDDHSNLIYVSLNEISVESK